MLLTKTRVINPLMPKGVEHKVSTLDLTVP